MLKFDGPPDGAMPNMEDYEYTVQLGQQKARNEREVEALLGAVNAKGLPVLSVMITVCSMNGLDAQQKLLASPQLSCLENLALKLDFSLGAESLGILANEIEAGKISSLQHLSICYHQADDQHYHTRLAVSPHSSSTSQSRSWRSQRFSSSRSRSLGAQSMSSSSSSSRSRTSNSQNGNSTQLAAAPVSWEGLALLARVLKKNLLSRLEKTVCLSSEWGYRNLGNLGVKYLAELIETGYLSRLTELNLENNSIGSAGMKALAGALRGGNLLVLESLNLNRNIFHDSVTGIMEILAIMEADHLPSLKWIGLSGAGRRTIPATERSIADAIVAVFTRNTALTAAVEIDWPDKRLEGRWNVVLERNLKVTRILEKLGTQQEVPVTNGKIFICGFPGVGKTTLRLSLQRSRFEAFFWKELKPHREKPTRGIEVTKIKEETRKHGIKCTLTLWDLAGQEDFHVLHSSFLPDLGMANGKATSFVVVLNAEYNRSPTESASAEEELVYWLRFIASNSIIGVKRTVTVILNTFNGAACTEKAQWIELLKSLHEKYEDLLDINTHPFVLDARVAKSVSKLKYELFKYARAALQDLRWPKICQYIQENLEGWSSENKNFPILDWYDFLGRLAASKLAPEKLEAAVEYLHETGDLIFFRHGSLVEGGNPDTKLIVLNPQWFCKRVVGQLLLPEGMLDEGETPLKRSVAPNGSLGIREIKAYFSELLTSGPQVGYVLGMLIRLGLCYKVGQDRVLIPALIEDDELPARYWGRDPRQYSAHWVMGRSLSLKDSERTTLPKALFRRLQVQLAQDPELGGLTNSDYVVGKSYLAFRKSGLSILVQFDVNEDDPRDDRIDLISRPLVSKEMHPAKQWKEQIDLVEKVMGRLQHLCLLWCPGILFSENVILPWRACDGALPMLDRNTQVSVEEIKRWLQRNWLRAQSEDYSDLNWSIGEEAVKEADLLSSSEMDELQSWAEAEGDALKQLVLDLEIMPEQCTKDSTTQASKRIEQNATSTTGSGGTLEKFTRTRRSGKRRPLPPVHLRIETEAEGVRNHIDQRILDTRKHLDLRFDEVVERTQEVSNNFRRAFEMQKLVLRKVQDLEKFSIEELESSVPRFMYLAEKERSGIWLTMQQAVVERSCRLHLMCEARYKDGVLHEVEGQKGLEITQFREWASVVAPWLERSLKVAIVAARVVGGVLLPGLSLLLPDFQNTEGSFLSLVINTNILNFSPDLSPIQDKRIDSMHMALHASAGNSTSSSSASGINAKAKFILQKLLGDPNTPLGLGILEHFGLSRVILTDPHDHTRSSLVWICSPCCRKYGKLARDASQHRSL